MERPIAVELHDDLCFKCLQRKKIHRYSLYRSEYGSSFDNNYTYLQVCDDCKPEGLEDWFNEAIEMDEDDYCADYKYEKNILDFIETLPLEGQELFWARCAYGACAYEISGQDWIDMKLGIMSEEKYEEYGYYSPQQKEAYKERFPACNHPINEIYDDNSKGCWCVFGADGEYGQTIGLNTCDECYKCKHYIPRYETIKEMTDDEFNEYKAYYIGKINYERFKNKFEK